MKGLNKRPRISMIYRLNKPNGVLAAKGLNGCYQQLDYKIAKKVTK